ncbi:MAG: TPM domain-containing protein [Bacteroidetes bacterium]|nr:MAG: TPM domain-containing protein [Bacteroidota bacterium]
MKNIIRNIKSSVALSIISFSFLLAGISSLQGQDLPDRPTPPRLLVDYTGILNASERTALENKLVSFNDTTSNQILVILTNDLYGHDIETFASGIGDKWGVGQADLDNGIVLVVKPKVGNNPGLAFISVGYGLTGAIPDITAGQIVDYEMIPSFKNNDYYSGIDQATTVLMELAAGEYSSDEYSSSRRNFLWELSPLIFFFTLLFLILWLSRRSSTIGSKPRSPWAAFWLGSAMGSGGRWGGSSSGSFGGFGGGGFGGGGAGGSW